jgi:hypothetical protein
LQLWVKLQLPRQFVQVGALRSLLIIDQHHAGQVDLRRQRRVVGILGKIGCTQGFGDFGVEPLLQLRVVGMAADLGGNHLLFLIVDLAVRLGGSDQRT